MMPTGSMEENWHSTWLSSVLNTVEDGAVQAEAELWRARGPEGQLASERGLEEVNVGTTHVEREALSSNLSRSPRR